VAQAGRVEFFFFDSVLWQGIFFFIIINFIFSKPAL